MKASELIEGLNKLVAEHGDLTIRVYTEDDGGNFDFEPASTILVDVGETEDVKPEAFVIVTDEIGEFLRDACPANTEQKEGNT